MAAKKLWRGLEREATRLWQAVLVLREVNTFAAPHLVFLAEYHIKRSEPAQQVCRMTTTNVTGPTWKRVVADQNDKPPTGNQEGMNSHIVRRAPALQQRVQTWSERWHGELRGEVPYRKCEGYHSYKYKEKRRVQFLEYVMTAPRIRLNLAIATVLEDPTTTTTRMGSGLLEPYSFLDDAAEVPYYVFSALHPA
jgi:hypothetical protein